MWALVERIDHLSTRVVWPGLVHSLCSVGPSGPGQEGWIRPS